MCWIHEWAFAWRNIASAINHIERAKLKMKFRSERFPRKREKYLEAMRRCEEIIAQLQKLQKELEELIWTYGIIKRPEYIKKLLTPPRMVPAEEWVEKN
jgi:outer membrane protein assembly factor BamD (BamD/ComL family)